MNVSSSPFLEEENKVDGSNSREEGAGGAAGVNGADDVVHVSGEVGLE